MKKLSILFALFLAGTVLLGTFVQPTAAQTSQPESAAQSISEDREEYLLVLPMPDPRNLNLPDRLNRDEARRAALAWAQVQAKDVIVQLNVLQREGKIHNYRFDSSEFTLRVETAAEAELSLTGLQELEGVSSLLSYDTPATCLTGYSQALAELFFQNSNQPIISQVNAPTYDAPTIYAYAPIGTDWTSIYGYSAGATSLTMRILRGGQLIYSETTTANGDGVYEFYPTWQGGCQGSSYNWTLRAGDVIRLDADGMSSSMVVDPLTGWIDPQNDQMVGVSSPNHTTRLSVWADRTNDHCNSDYYEAWVFTSDDGSFLADFTAQVDVDPSSSGLVFVFDNNYNATYMWTYPFSMFVDPLDGSLSGSLLPNQQVDLRRVRGSETVRFAITSGPDGYIYADLFEDFQPGDQVSLSSGSTEITYSVVEFSGTADPATNLISGNTAANHLVKVTSNNHAYKSGTSVPLSTACNILEACATIRSTGEGSFSLVNSFDLRRGDAISFRVYDFAGNGQNHSYKLPVIAANPSADRLLGYWALPWVELEVLVSDSGGSLKTSMTVEAWYDHSFDAALNVDLVAGDLVTVTNGVVTTAMTVQAVSAHLNSTSDMLSGSAAAGFQVLDMADYDPITGSITHACTENSSFPGGSYTANLAAYGIEAADEAYVSIRSGDHLTFAYSHALQMKARLDHGSLSGYSPLPNEAVKATLLTGSGGTEIETQNVLSGADGAYEISFEVGTFTGGQRIRLVSGGEANEMNVPLMAIHLDSAANSIYGQALASRPAIVTLFQAIGCGGACTRSLQITDMANTAGVYSVSFLGWRWPDCKLAEVDGMCVFGSVETVRADEHSLSLFSPPPMPVWPDVYEDDNSVADALLYTGLSHHTFHVEEDVDWVAFTVGAEDVGQSFYIDTVNLGPLEDTKMILYDTDGGTILKYSDDGPVGVGSQIIFSPDDPGTYYVKIFPYSQEDNTGNCGATYSFLITRYRIFLPIVRR